MNPPSDSAWSRERREFGLTAREEILDAREAELDERERKLDERTAALGQFDDDADTKRELRADHQRGREERATNRREHDENIHEQLSSGEYPLAAQFAHLATQLFTAKSPELVLEQLVQVTPGVIGNVDAVSVTVHSNTLPQTPAASNEFARELDQLQYQYREGPCLEAVATPGLAYAVCADLSQRTVPWPSFAHAATEAGCLSVLSLGMFPAATDSLPRLGSLNVYSTVRDAFSDEDRLVAMVLAAHGAVAMASATALDQAHLESEQFREGMLSRDVIGQAKGILMERQKCTPEQAFDVLRQASNQLNTKLVDVAEQVAHTGQEPETKRSGLSVTQNRHDPR